MRTANLELDETRLERLEAFLSDNREEMLEELDELIVDVQDMLEDDDDADDRDVRLCIDLDGRYGARWQFRTGDVAYDPRHSEYCVASSISLETDSAEELLDELVSQLD